MSAIEDRLEILIGKLLDGEISPAEQRWLDDELERNEDARNLLAQLRTLSNCGRQVVAAEIHSGDSSPEEILQRAWQQHERPSWRRVIRVAGHLRFAAGLAAGFALGLVLHFALVRGGVSVTAPVDPRAVAVNIPVQDATPDALDTGPVRYPRPVMRNVDWYSFTDQTGNQWLVEGVREGAVRPAVYSGDL